ncbi:MAG: type IX secretion system protein PorQ [Bacteroidota bacterium]
MRIAHFVIYLSYFSAFGQYNFGTNGFQYLNGFYVARNIGTGNNLISVVDNDLVLSSENPALLQKSMANQLALNQTILPTGVNFGSVQYAFNTKFGIFSPLIKYANYGSFEATDIGGNSLGNFGALDYSVGMLYSKEFNPVISLGVGFNVLGSHLETYSAYAFSSIFSAVYKHPNNLFSATLFTKGIGTSFKQYTSNRKTSLPIDVQASLSYKLKHAPFRFSLLAKQLNRWDIVYQDPNEKPTYDALTGDTIPVNKPGFMEKLAHHLNLQVELIASKSLHFRTGFDFHRQQQLRVYNRPGLAGFSFGVGIYLKKVRFDYGVMIYSKAGQNHAVGLSTNLSDWKKKH